MFRPNKQRSDSSALSGERFDFKLSNLQALQVPKGWDKLSVSIASTETGKAVGKSAKAHVWNGSCHWTESFSESVWIPAHDSSNGDEGCHLKILVFMGSTRSGTLGEATVHLTNFTSSRTPVPVSLPLKKCSHGTVLHMKVQCLNLRTKIRDEPGKDITSPEETNIDYDDMENKSDVSDNMSRMSSGSASSNHTDAQFHPGELFTRETSFSTAGSHYISDTGEGSFGRDTFSPQRYLNGSTSSNVGRQDSASSSPNSVSESPSRSNNSFSSKTSRSRNSFNKEDSHRRTFIGSPLRSSSTSKELIEAVEVTVEEARTEARMWEKNARKAMADLENLQDNFSNELEEREALQLELSTSKAECDGLRLEIGELKASLEELNYKQKPKNNMSNLQQELEKEAKFLKESNANLSVQLQKTQESNIELVSILQEMEETIEKQKQEIADLLAEKSEDESGPADSQDGNLTKTKSAVSKEDVNEENIDDPNLVLEVESLKLKVQELEKDCNELTDENLQLLLKLKESQNLQGFDASSNTLVKDGQEGELLGSTKTELDSRVCDLEKEFSMKNAECSILGEKCTKLEVQLQNYRDRVSQLDAEVEECRAESYEWEIRFAELEKQFDDYKNPKEIPVVEDAKLSLEIESLESEKKELQLRISDLKQELSMKSVESSTLGEKCNDLEFQLLRDKVSQLDAEVRKSHAKAEDWEIRCAELEQQLEDYKSQKEIPVADDANFRSGSDELEMMKGTYLITQGDQQEAILNILDDMGRLVSSEDGGKLVGGAMDENTILMLDRRLTILHNSLESKLRDLNRELLDKSSELDKIKAENSANCEEAGFLRHREREMEIQVGSIEDEKLKLVLANEVFVKKALELEIDMSAQEDHLSELEQENVSLSERICGLEAQLRYLTDEKEASRLAMESSESRCLKLQEDVRELKLRMEAQKVDLTGKLSEVQKQLSETKEECSYLRIANQKLEATAEKFMEECSFLQKANADLRVENLHLNGESSVLQAELHELKRAFNQLLAEIDALRDKYDSVLEEAAVKEGAINAELDLLLLENKRINSCEKEVAFPISGSEIENKVGVEFEAKVLQLTGELSASNQRVDVLMVEREKLLRLLENFKSKEAMTESNVRRVELKLKRVEYERKHLVEEISSLRDHLQKAELLQTEVLNLRRAFDEAKMENERLEASVQVLRGDYEEAKSERNMLAEKISSMESSLRELESCKIDKFTLEERVFRLEGDLTAREALYTEDAELKNEVARVRRTNNQLQRRISAYEKRAQALEEELKQTSETPRSSVLEESSELSTLQNEEMHEGDDHSDLRQREVVKEPDEDPVVKIQSLEIELAEANEANNMYKEQLKSLLFESGDTNKVLSLEHELRELRESYLHMSLKYAQGESEKEELMMKLKAT